MKRNIFILMIILMTTINITFSQDNVLTALQSELNRSIENLSLRGEEKPYFISYNVSDTRKLDIKTSFGGILTSKDNRSRNGSIEMRIGNYNFDNSNFAGSGLFYFSNRIQLPIEDDIYPIKYELWLATDKVYKAAIDEMSRKKAAMQNKTYSEKIDDFSKESPEKYLEEKGDFSFDKNKLERKSIEFSKIFKKYPEISKSVISISFTKGNNYYLNTEGTVMRNAISSLEIIFVATAIDKKGNRYSDFISFFGRNESDLLSEKIMFDSINSMAKSLVSLLNSPECEDYIGPVLITNDASPNFFSQVLSKSLSGRPSPFSQSTSLSSSYSSSQLLRKIGKKIMPEYLSVFDDSYAERFSNQILFGHYKYDDEGVKASKVQIVENGILKELLMCRKPNNKISKSNGHGRHDLFHKSDARPSNVFITSTQNIGYLDLKNKLVKICKEQGLEYGIIIKKISDIGVFSQFVESFSSSLPSSRSNEISVSLPIFVYRVFTKDGREELIRGLNFSNINLKTLDDIVSASNDSYVYNLNQKGNTGDLPTSFIAPSVLIEEMELVCEKEQNKKPPILKHPYFSER